MSTGPNVIPLDRARSQQPEPPMAVLVMLSKEDDRVVVVDLSTHPCGQHILDDYAEGAQLVSADHLRGTPAADPF